MLVPACLKKLLLKYRNTYRIPSWSLKAVPAAHVGNAHAYNLFRLQIETLASVNASPHHFGL